MNQNQYSHSSGKQKLSGGFNKANMNAFIFAGSKRKRKKRVKKV